MVIMNSINHSTEVFGLENGSEYIYYVRCNSTEGYVNDDDRNITFSVDAGIRGMLTITD